LGIWLELYDNRKRLR